MRVGIGWDVHKLVRGKKLVLGGMEIPYQSGLEGHSDADVLIHSIIDALLGAAGCPDIGQNFPPSDNKYKNISSQILLSETLKIIKSKKYEIINIDSTIIAEKPKLGSYIKKMRANIANTLKISDKNINIKSKTEEGLGYIGKGKAISAMAVCLLEAKS